MRQIVMEIDLNGNKDQTWDLLFNQFGSVSNFNPVVEQSFDFNDKAGEVGCERQCNFDTAGKKYVRERITKKWDNGFHIDIFDGALPMIKEMNADIYIDPIDEQNTRVKFQLNFQTKPKFMGAIMKGKMKQQFFPILIGMKYHLETGGLVDKNNIKQIKQEYENGSKMKGFTFQPNVQFA